jgi:hypothetical protein
MKRQIAVWLALSAALLVPASEPVRGQRVATVEQKPRRTTPTAKKKYSTGVKDTAVAEPQPPARPGAVRWEPLIGFDSQIFPSFIISTATIRLPQEEDVEEDPRQLGEALGFIGVALEDVPANARLRVEVKANSVMDASVFEGRAAVGAGDYEVYQLQVRRAARVAAADAAQHQHGRLGERPAARHAERDRDGPVDQRLPVHHRGRRPER